MPRTGQTSVARPFAVRREISSAAHGEPEESGDPAAECSRLGDGYTVVICSRIDLLTAEPYVDALEARGVALRIACTGRIAEAVRSRFPAHAGDLIDLDDAARGTVWARRVHNTLCVLLEGPSPSRNIRKQFLKREAERSWKIRTALSLSRCFPNLTQVRLNRLLGRCIGWLLDNPFPTRQVLAVSHVTTPHLLCARNLEVITLNESWDHAGGKCAGYPSAAVIAWNKDIGRDWQRFQGAEVVVTGAPIKLAYALEAPRVMPSEGDRVAMYAVGTCATELDWYTEELRLIEVVCKATHEAGWDLIIKPRPAGPQPDLPELAHRFPHVRLAQTSLSLGTRDYYLDDEYNRTRLEELSRCSLVINTITTFCLDAACAGVDVLQLDLRGRDTFPALARAQENYHLARYLLQNPSLCFEPAEHEAWSESLLRFFRNPDQRPSEFSRTVRAWISPGASVDEQVSEVADWLAGHRRGHPSRQTNAPGRHADG